jgi:hypothetical protein
MAIHLPDYLYESKSSSHFVVVNQLSEEIIFNKIVNLRSFT